MLLEVWLAFVITASIIIVIPGPTIIYIVGQSLTHGKKASLPLSIGVITGDALCISLSLLGISCAEKCAHNKMRIVFADIEGEALYEAESEMRTNGAELTAVVTDVSNVEDVKNLAQKTIETYGTVDL